MPRNNERQNRKRKGRISESWDSRKDHGNYSAGYSNSYQDYYGNQNYTGNNYGADNYYDRRDQGYHARKSTDSYYDQGYYNDPPDSYSSFNRPKRHRSVHEGSYIKTENVYNNQWNYEGHTSQSSYNSKSYDDEYYNQNYTERYENYEETDMPEQSYHLNYNTAGVEYEEYPHKHHPYKRKNQNSFMQPAAAVDPVEDLLNFNLQVINDKLKEISQNPKKRDMTNKLVNITMNVLLNCAEHLSAAETKPVKVEDEGTSTPEVVTPEQILLGVVRVGAAKKKVIVDIPWVIGDELIVLSQQKPTKPLVTKVHEYMKEHVNIKLREIVCEADVTLMPNFSILISLKSAEPQYKVLLRFSSPQYSQGLDEEFKLPNPCVDDLLLNQEECCESLVKIRQIRWFDHTICLRLEAPVIRVLLYLSQKIPEFKSLNLDAIEVLVKNSTTELGEESNRYSLLVHVLQALAGGIFLPTGGGLACPYNHALDFGALLTSQEKEDITFGAQKAVRVVMFHGMERLLF